MRHPRQPCDLAFYQSGALSLFIIGQFLVTISSAVQRWPWSQQWQSKVSDLWSEHWPGKAFEAPVPREARKTQPHLVFLLIDDMGWNDFVDSSDMHVAWPFTKKLLKRSIKVNTTYTQPVCAPSRSSFMTGRYRNMLADYFDWGAFSTKSEVTLAQKLRSVGYMTYVVGKWHLGSSVWATTPTGRGFHRFFGAYANANHFEYCSKDNSGKHFDLHYQEDYAFAGGESLAQSIYLNASHPLHKFESDKVGQYSTELYDRKAREFMLDHHHRYPDKPFFLYYALSAMHHPLEAPDIYFKKCPQAAFPNENRQHACAMAVAVDAAIKNLTVFMESTFRDENYVVVITSDNGGPAWSKTSGGSNYPLRGSKGETWEGGVRNHALVWGSHADLQSAKGTTYTGGFMHLVDWHATLAHLGGVEAGVAHGTNVGDTDGYSMWDALTTNGPSPREELLIHYATAGKVEELLQMPSENVLNLDFNPNRPYCKSGKNGRPMIVFRSKQWKLLFNTPYGEKCGGWWKVRNTTNDVYLSGKSGQPLYYHPDTQEPIFDDIEVKYQHADHLFDLESDPTESQNLAGSHAKIVDRLRRRALAIIENGRISRGCESVTCGGASCCNNPSCCTSRKQKSMLHAFEAEGANIPNNPCTGSKNAQGKSLAYFPWFDRM